MQLKIGQQYKRIDDVYDLVSNKVKQGDNTPPSDLFAANTPCTPDYSFK